VLLCWSPRDFGPNSVVPHSTGWPCNLLFYLAPVVITVISSNDLVDRMCAITSGSDSNRGLETLRVHQPFFISATSRYWPWFLPMIEDTRYEALYGGSVQRVDGLFPRWP
jgi:hypothetical protein